MKRVAILTYNNAALFELGCAVELFGLARPEFENWYQTEVISLDSGPHQTTGGLQLIAKQVVSLDDYDMLVIPSWPVAVSQIKNQLADHIHGFHQQGKRLIAFCSGAFLLAGIGLLDNRQATTHWRYAKQFKDRYPRVDYVDNVLYTLEHDDYGLIGCSAGSAAGLDLGLEIIRLDFGQRIANQVAKRLVISSQRKGGQAQFVETHYQQDNPLFHQATDWALANLNEPMTIDVLASKAGMSRRTFDRKFKKTFNQTAKNWLTHQRLARAKQLLEESEQQIEVIAGVTGFDNATTMRHHFRKELGVSPRQYRDQFAKAFT